MTILRFPVAVVMDCVPVGGRWACEQWRPSAVVPLAVDPPDAGIQTDEIAGTTQWRFSPLWIELHRSEGEGYWLNLTSPAPKAFVMWRAGDEGVRPAVRPHAVTVSYNEAARMLDAGEQVDGVALAPELHAWMKPFVDANYTPQPRRKTRRNDPFAAERTDSD